VTARLAVPYVPLSYASHATAAATAAVKSGPRSPPAPLRRRTCACSWRAGTSRGVTTSLPTVSWAADGERIGRSDTRSQQSAAGRVARHVPALRGTVTRRSLAHALTFATALAAADVATSAERPPPDVPAISAYVELFPTASGPVAARGPKRPGRPLSPTAEERLSEEGGREASTLAEIVASSPASGSERPSGGEPASPSASEGRGDGELGASVSPDASASTAATGAAGDGRVVGLVAALALATAALVAMWLLARRRPR
jgi:hypothetical protein